MCTIEGNTGAIAATGTVDYRRADGPLLDSNEFLIFDRRQKCCGSFPTTPSPICESCVLSDDRNLPTKSDAACCDGGTTFQLCLVYLCSRLCLCKGVP